jgi:nucleotide-binding universal stress UspA family protein
MSAETTLGRRRIVVGVDGSESSIHALEWAQRLGSGIGAEIDAITTWEYPATYGMSAGLPAEWNPAEDAAQTLATALKSAFDDDEPGGIRSVIVEGHPAKVLLDASVDAEMLVVGSRGHGGFVGLLIGATSAYCAEHALCPVVVVHDKP